MMLYNLFMKYFIYSLLIFLTISSLFFYDILIIWLLLEITNFLFICLLIISTKDKKMIFFYFIIQIIPSFLMIYSIIMNNIFFTNNYFYFIMLMSLMIKLSLPPFHLWLPIISKYLNWNNLFLMLTLQKISPFYMLSLFKLNSFISSMILILCAIIPPYMMFNLNNFKILMAYSSINQSGWMMLLIYLKNIVWFKYFLFYSFINMSLFILFHMLKNNFTFINNMSNFKINLFSIIFILNLAGMPPFSFFYMKWYMTFLIIFNSHHIFILMMLMISSLFMLYIYTNMIMITFYIFKLQSKLYMKSFMPLTNKLNIIFTMSLTFSVYILIM
uniref:NADH-ubiquinone oxidoreductase chain 2 n=1 Tax=Crematogaster teranishii TaxID=2586727 RepID=A0A7L8Y496_9HYME|nr:NADH dehydrogenase subunit 2 [Crematogaster teranishii]QOI14037.1 NADH dehydrogenase subunit 2 [Crematogaster teranishii]